MITAENWKTLGTWAKNLRPGAVVVTKENPSPRKNAGMSGFESILSGYGYRTEATVTPTDKTESPQFYVIREIESERTETQTMFGTPVDGKEVIHAIARNLVTEEDKHLTFSPMDPVFVAIDTDALLGGYLADVQRVARRKEFDD